MINQHVPFKTVEIPQSFMQYCTHSKGIPSIQGGKPSSHTQNNDKSRKQKQRDSDDNRNSIAKMTICDEIFDNIGNWVEMGDSKKDSESTSIINWITTTRN